MHWIIPQILCYFLSKGLFWRPNSSRPNTERLCCLLPQWVQNVKLCLTFNRETFSTDLTCDWLTDLLDAGIYAYHYSRYDGGAHNGLALDDPFFYHPQHHPHWTLHGEFCLNAAETCWVMEVDVCLWLTCSLFSFFSLFPSLLGSRSQQGTYKVPCLLLTGSLGWMVPPYLKENYGNLKWWVWEVPFSLSVSFMILTVSLKQ